LYNLAVVKKEKNNNLNQMQTSQILHESRQKHTDENTETIFLETKIHTFKKLFKILDSDQDGEVSIFCSDFKKITPSFKKLLNPIINEMREKGSKFNIDSFTYECDQLFNV
jgi:Ca2+-binding EF-hand superfamily protein